MSNSKPLICKRCNMTFSRAQDLKTHRTRVHNKKASGNPIKPVAEKVGVSHLDVIEMLNVKINALVEVRKMLEGL